jgi:hypothetical protein
MGSEVVPMLVSTGGNVLPQATHPSCTGPKTPAGASAGATPWVACQAEVTVATDHVLIAANGAAHS